MQHREPRPSVAGSLADTCPFSGKSRSPSATTLGAGLAGSGLYLLSEKVPLT